MRSVPFKRSWVLANPQQLATEVHVWCANLDFPAAQLWRLARTLSADEQRRAERFYFERDRRRFIASHGVLRTILASYLDTSPAHLQFSVGRHGKPALRDAYPGPPLCFNMSHSHNTALYAITSNRAIGVDIEHCHPLPDMAQLAQRFFFPSEYAALCSLAPALQTAYFFAVWTCKEAYLKATGEGLTGLEQVEIELLLDSPAAPVCRCKSAGQTGCWSLQTWQPRPGYQAALAVDGEDWELVQIPDGSVRLNDEDLEILNW